MPNAIMGAAGVASDVAVLDAFDETAVDEHAPEKIAAVNTNMQLDEERLQAVLKGMDEMRVLPRSPRLPEIADLAAFLASDRADAVTGSFINAAALFL